MKYKYNNLEYDVEIIRKNNKNTYLRFKNNKIVVTTNYFVSDKKILKLVQDNKEFINKNIDNSIKKEEDNDFKLFGKAYNIIFINTLKEVEIEGNRIYTKDSKMLDKYLSKYIYNIYLDRLNYWYSVFVENIPPSNLKIRKMKSRWGVCNIKNKNVTLNLLLSNYDIKYLDYVIIHELCHFIHPNHSKDFWNLVKKYNSDYKQIRLDMKKFNI